MERKLHLVCDWRGCVRVVRTLAHLRFYALGCREEFPPQENLISSGGIFYFLGRNGTKLRKNEIISPKFHLILPKKFPFLPWRIFISQRTIGKFLGRSRKYVSIDE